MKAVGLVCVVSAAVLSLLGGAHARNPSSATGPPRLLPGPKTITTDSGLQYIDLAVGKGATPKNGQTVIVHYTGWLDDGLQFTSSRDQDKPFGFPPGSGRVIKGWDEGVASMRVGGRRRLIVPSELAYGSRGIPGIVPSNAQLTFDIELLRIEK